MAGLRKAVSPDTFHALGAGATGDTVLCDEETGDDASDKAWLESQKHTAVGRLAIDHWTHIVAIYGPLGPHSESPVDQCLVFREVLARGLSMRERMAGLPAKLPSFITAGCLSGKIVLMHSENSNLIKYFAQTPQPSSQQVEGVKKVIAYARRHGLVCVCCCSWPFHGVVQHHYWSVFTLRRTANADGGGYKVEDGQLAFELLSHEPAMVGSVLYDRSEAELELIDRQVAKFCQHVSAADMDAAVAGKEPPPKLPVADGRDAPSDPDRALVAAKQRDFFKAQCGVLQAERKQDQAAIADLNRQLKEIDGKHRAALQDAQAQMARQQGKIMEKAQAAEKLHEDLLKEERRRCEALTRACAAEREKVRAVKADVEAAEQVREEAVGAANKQLEKAKVEVNSAKSQVGQVRKECAKLRASNEALKIERDAAQQAAEALCAAEVQKLSARCTEASERAAYVQHAMEQLSNEKDALQSELDVARKAQRRERWWRRAQCAGRLLSRGRHQ